MTMFFVPVHDPVKEALVLQVVENGGVLVSVHPKVSLSTVDTRRCCAFSSHTDLIKAMLESSPASKAKILKYLQDEVDQKGNLMKALRSSGGHVS